MSNKFVKCISMILMIMMLATSVPIEAFGQEIRDKVQAESVNASTTEEEENASVDDQLSEAMREKQYLEIRKEYEALQEEEHRRLLEEEIAQVRKERNPGAGEKTLEKAIVLNDTSSERKSFTVRTSCPDTSNSYYFSTSNPFYPAFAPTPGTLDALGNCTWYAWGRAYEILGTRPQLSTGNAGDWYNYNWRNDYYSYSSSVPKVGAIACWSNHVAVVEKVNSDGTIMISESSYKVEGVTDGIRFQTRDHLSATSPYNYGDTFQGYIYLGNFGGELYSGKYKGLDWNITKSGTLTISGTATEKFDEYSFSWTDYIATYNSTTIKKIIVDIAGDNIYSMAGWFEGFKGNSANIKEIVFKNIDTSKVTNMGKMFYGCESLTELDVSSFDTSEVTDMHWMFFGCDSLTKLDVSGFDTGNVMDMGDMFLGCVALEKLDVSNFDTSKVTNMGNMFGSCESLTELDVSGFDTSKVTSMYGMFSWCTSLTILEVSDFNTINVIAMDYMFYRCRSLTQLDLSNFDMSFTVIADDMLTNMDSLNNLKTPKNLGISVSFLSSRYENGVWHNESLTMYDALGNEYTELPKNMSTSITLYQNVEDIPENVDIAIDEGVVVPKGEFWIRVLNGDGQAISRATVEYNGLCVDTDAEGIAKLSNYEKGFPLTIKADGYVDRTVDRYIRKSTGYDTIVMDIGMQSVIFTLNGRDIDLLSNSKSIDLKNKGTLFDLTVKAENSKINKYAVYSGERLVAESDNGKFTNLCYKSFQKGKTVAVRCYSANGVLLESKKLNLTVKHSANIPSSISMGNGIKITLGEEVPLLGGTQIEISLDDLPVTVEEKNGKLKVLLGYEFGKFSLKEEDCFKKIKSLNKDTYSQFLKEMSSGKKVNYDTKGINFKNKINGYLEAPEGLGTSLSGKLYYEGTVSYKKENQMTVATVPVVLELTIEGKWTEGGGFEWTIQDGLAGNITIGGSVEVSLYAGVGVANLASAGAYGSVKLGLEWQWLPIEEQKFNEIYIEGKAGLQVKVFGKSVGKIILWNGKYYFIKKDTSHSTLSTISQLSIDYDTIYPNATLTKDVSAYDMAKNDQYGNLTEQILQDSVSADIDPQIVTTQTGIRMLAYIDNNDGRTDGNKSTLVYSIYDENNQSWGTPAIVYDNGTADFNPDLYADGENIYAVWQDAETALENNLTLNQIADKLNLTIAKYDSQSGEFDVIDSMEGELLKQQPQIVAKDGKIRVYWHENSEDNVLGLSGTNHFYYAEWMESLESILLLDSKMEEAADTEEITETEVEESEEESTIEETITEEETSEAEEVSSSEEILSTEEVSSVEETESVEEGSSADSKAEKITDISMNTITETSVKEAESESECEKEEATEGNTESFSKEVDIEEDETESRFEVAKTERDLSGTARKNIYSLGESTDAVLSQDAGVVLDELCFAVSTGILNEEYNVASGKVLLWENENSRTICEGRGTNVTFTKLYDEMTLTWFENGDIYYLDQYDRVNALLGSNILSGVDYVLLQDADGNPSLIYAQSGDDSSNLYQIGYSSDQGFLAPVCISTQDQYIQNVDGFCSGEGWELVYNKMTVEDLEEHSNILCTGRVNRDISDLELQQVSVYDDWDEESVQQIMESSLTIYNAGNMDADSFVISLEDSDGIQLDSRPVEVRIPIGESVVLNVEYPKSLFTKKDTYTWKISGVSEESRTDNNSYLLEIGASCLEVDAELIQTGSTETVEIAIVNRGLEESGGTLKIMGYETQTEHLSQQFDAIKAGETKIFTCNISEENFMKKDDLNLSVEVIPDIEQENSELLKQSLTVKAPQYTVCFMQEDLEPYYVFDIKYGDTVTFPKNPQKEGSYFAGWCTEDDILYTEESAITQNITLYPLWKEENTTISMEQCSVSAIADQYYTGKALKPNVTVKYGNVLLKKGKDYSVSYSNNKNQGTATVTISGMRSYTGSITRNFKIYYNISKASAAKIATQNYTGEEIRPTIKLNYNKSLLTQGRDYTVSYGGNKDAGTASVTITGKGKYRGSKTVYFTIKGIALSAMKFEKVESLTYNGEKQYATVVVKDKKGNALRKGIDYQLVYQNTDKAGNATITVIGQGNYSGSKNLICKILPGDFTKANVNMMDAVTYTGKAIKIAPEVSWNGITLKENVDYTLSYKNNSKAGKASVTMTGKGNYKGKITREFVIEPLDLENDDTVRIEVADMAYTGKQLKPKVTVYFGEAKLTAGNYTVTYADNLNIGMGSVTVTGKGNYKGSRTETFRIVEKNQLLSRCKVQKPATMIYKGIPLTPEVVVTDGNYVLKQDTDYLVTYVNNNKVGNATAIIKGIGTYAGTKSVSFKISPKQLADQKGVLGEGLQIFPIENALYNGYAQKPAILIEDGEMVLKEGRDYTLFYKNNTQPGMATVTISGKGNYSGKTTVQFIIESWDFDELTISIEDQIYNGKVQKPIPEFALRGKSITLRQGIVYSITYSNNKDVGKAGAVIKGKGMFKSEEPVSLDFYIDQLDIENAVISNIPNQTYKGVPVTPIPKVKVGKLVLKYGRDFTAEYSRNGKKGEATVIVSGIGNYSGTCEKTFIIQ